MFLLKCIVKKCDDISAFHIGSVSVGGGEFFCPPAFEGGGTTDFLKGDMGWAFLVHRS